MNEGCGIFVLIFMVFAFGITFINIKLYTEIMKEKSQQKRGEK